IDARPGEPPSRCTCPNEMTSWKASANSARYEPHLERDRKAPMVVTLRASQVAEPFRGPSENSSYNVTLRQSAAVRILCCVAENHQGRVTRRQRTREPMRSYALRIRLTPFAHPGRGEAADEEQKPDESSEYRQHADAAHHACLAHAHPDPVVAFEVVAR